MSTHYSKPKKLNLVSLFMALLALAALYGSIQFGPPYYRKWKAKGFLSELANRAYPKRLLTGDAETELLDQIKHETVTQLRALGINDPTLRISVEKSSTEIGIRAEYVERIQHPLVNKTTVLFFRPYSSASVVEP